jgi:hypothetical protein
VLAVGGEIARIDLETGVERLPASGLHGGDATGVAVLAGDLFVTTEEGGLFASQDGGTTFSEAGGWRAQLRPEDAAAGVDIVGSKVDGLWGKTAQGVLLHSLDGERWKKVDVGGFVRAVGLDEAGRAVVLVRTLGAHELLRRQGDAWARAAIPTDTVPPGLVGAATVAARAKVLAVAIEGQGVFRSLDGVAWSPIPGTEAVTAMAVLDATGAVVVGLTGAEADVQASLVRIGPDGEPATVATWEDRAEGEPGVAAIVVDDAHEVVWVGGGFGLAVFQPRMPGSTRAIPV